MKETKFNGMVLNGFLMLFVTMVLLIAAIVGVVFAIIDLDASGGPVEDGYLEVTSCFCLLILSACVASFSWNPMRLALSLGLVNTVVLFPKRASTGSILSMERRK